MPNFLHKANGTFTDGGFWSFGIETSGSITETSAESAWGGAVAAFFGDTNVKTYYAPGTELTATSTSTADSTFHQTTITRTTHAVVGTSAGAQLPTYVGLVCSFYTSTAARRGRGRIFLPATTSDMLDGSNTGRMNATDAGHIATALTTLFGTLTTAGLSQILYVRKTTKTGVVPYTTSVVTSRRLQEKFHVQKRRSDKIVGGTITV